MTSRLPPSILLTWTACLLATATGRAVDLPHAAPLPAKIAVAPGPFQPTDEFLQAISMSRLVPRRQARHLGRLGTGVGARAGRLVRPRLYDPGGRRVQVSRRALRASFEVRFQGHHSALEGPALGPRPPDGALQEGRGQILLHDRRTSRQLRLLELEVSAVELRQYGPQAGHRRRVAEGRTKTRPAVRHDRAPRGKLVVLRPGQGGGQDGPAGRSFRTTAPIPASPPSTGPTTCGPRVTTIPRRRTPCSGSGSIASTT